MDGTSGNAGAWATATSCTVTLLVSCCRYYWAPQGAPWCGMCGNCGLWAGGFACAYKAANVESRYYNQAKRIRYYIQANRVSTGGVPYPSYRGTHPSYPPCLLVRMNFGLVENFILPHLTPNTRQQAPVNISYCFLLLFFWAKDELITWNVQLGRSKLHSIFEANLSQEGARFRFQRGSRTTRWERRCGGGGRLFRVWSRP